MSDKSILIEQLQLGATNDEIIEKMRLMKAWRESGGQSIVCTINGFGSDPRNLWEIVEVRAFCRRLVDTGFVSYLDPIPIPTEEDPLIRNTWTFAEVWLCSEGKLASKTNWHEVINSKQFLNAIAIANAKSDSLIGPLN